MGRLSYWIYADISRPALTIDNGAYAFGRQPWTKQDKRWEESDYSGTDETPWIIWTKKKLSEDIGSLGLE